MNPRTREARWALHPRAPVACWALACWALCLPGRADTAQHSLWELHGKHNTVYLLGSIHVLRPSDYPLAPVVLDAYRNAKSLLMEINLEEIDGGEVQTEMLASAMLPDGQSLPQIMGPSALCARGELWRARSASTCRRSINSRPGSPPKPFRSCS